jgi:hypothetical protein
MSMAQMWTVIGIMATAFAAMIGFWYRAMTEQRKTLMARMDGSCGELNARMDGLRGEFDGLRGEFTSLHALSIKVRGQQIPPGN